jgi:RNA polymerase sigma-70 factor, ECF subfamily
MPEPVPSDGALIEDFVGGRATAFDALVRRYQAEVYGFLVRMVGDESLADDLFQDTFLRVMAALPTYRDKGRFRSWLFSVARNKALDALRRSKLERNIFERRSHADGDDVAETEGVTEPALAPDVLAERRELAERLDRAIATLPTEQREVVMLRHSASLTFREIAEVTGDSINTVMGRMRYANSALSKLLAPIMMEDGQ